MSRRARTPARRRRLVGRAAAAIPVATLAAVGAPSATAPAAASTDFEAATWNMAMGNSNYARYGDALAFAYALVANNQPPPWVVSFQEICASQYARLNGQVAGVPALTPLGYMGTFKAVHPSSNCPDGIRGNAVFAVGFTAPQNRFDWTLGPHDAAVDDEARFLTCAIVQANFVYKACTLHASHKHPYPAVLQGIDAHNKVQSVGGWSVVGGDFNQAPGESTSACVGCAPVSSSEEWDQTHVEAADLDPGYLTIDGDINQKYDYIWSGKNGSELRVKTGCTAVKNSSGELVSDHRYCRGKFRYL